MFEKLKSWWWLAFFLKRYIQSDNRRPKRYPEQGRDTVDGPVVIDKYWERNSDQRTVEINEKVREAVADLKSRGIWWRGGEQ